MNFIVFHMLTLMLLVADLVDIQNDAKNQKNDSKSGILVLIRECSVRAIQ